jgi:biotin operon repressor
MEDMEFQANEGDEGVHIDIGSHDVEAPEEEEEEEAMPVVAARSTYSLRSENARLKSRMERLEAEIRREKFSREIDILEQDGYRIPESQRDNLMTQLQASRDPVALLESWRSLFSRDPIGAKIDMSRAAMPKTVSGGDISSLVKEFAGKPEEFAKAINSRIKR